MLNKNLKLAYTAPLVDTLFVELEGTSTALAASWDNGSISDNNWNELGEY